MKIRLKECANVVDLSFNKTYDVEKSNDQSFMVIDDVKERNWIDKEDCKIVQSSVVEKPKNYLIGTICEVYVKGIWRKAEVLARDHNIFVCRYEVENGFKYGGFVEINMRPIKSEKEKEIEELAQHINDFMEGFTITESLEEYLYNQGYTKRSRVEDDLKNPPKRK